MQKQVVEIGNDVGVTKKKRSVTQNKSTPFNPLKYILAVSIVGFIFAIYILIPAISLVLLIGGVIIYLRSTIGEIATCTIIFSVSAGIVYMGYRVWRKKTRTTVERYCQD